MQIDLLINLVEEMAGEGSGKIVEILFNKKDVNEFLIAKKMDLTINQVRNILYKLSAEGLVSFIRKKDKRKGWYIYFWTLNTEKCLMKLELELVKKIGELKKSLENRQTQRFYICKNCAIEVTEEKALEEDFACSECAEVYTLMDNTNLVRDLKGRITRKEKELIEIRTELESMREKERQAKERQRKKEEKEKAAKKAKKKSSKKKKVSKKKTTKKKAISKKPKKKISKKKKAKKQVKKSTKKKAKKKKR